MEAQTTSLPAVFTPHDAWAANVVGRVELHRLDDLLLRRLQGILEQRPNDAVRHSSPSRRAKRSSANPWYGSGFIDDEGLSTSPVVDVLLGVLHHGVLSGPWHPIVAVLKKVVAEHLGSTRGRSTLRRHHSNGSSGPPPLNRRSNAGHRGH